MTNMSILAAIKHLHRNIFTTREISALTGRSSSSVIQSLNNLQRQGILVKIHRGIWGAVDGDRINPYSVVPFLLSQNRAYVSFISALHLHNMIEQIPQVITVASTAHTKKIQTAVGTYIIYRIHPLFFKGFDWDKQTKSYLIADPEKALIDCLYLSAHKGKHYGHFPELHFSRSFSFKKARAWIKEIKNTKVRSHVQKRFDQIVSEHTTSQKRNR